jgi:hypothetical protein
MVLPPGHGQAIVTPRRLSLREKRLIASVLAVVAVLVIALVVSLATGGRASARGCIHATIPGAVGAEEIDQCGTQARATCRTAKQPGSFTPASARVIAAECRKAGLPVGVSR